MKLCECGCGQPAPLANMTNVKRGYVSGQPRRFVAGHYKRPRTSGGYLMRTVVGHPRGGASGCVYEHVLVAEKALGKLLPAGVEVHHVDEDQHNNANSNLVICQDKAFHKLLHVRSRVVRAGGNPDTDRLCAKCRLVLPRSAFNRMRGNIGYGLQNACRECMENYRRERKAKRRAAAA